MADLANLRISVDSREVRTATNSLDRLGRSASEAERSAKRVSSGFSDLKASLTALGFGAIAIDMVRANMEFQRLQAALTVATGSAYSASTAFTEIRKFAATTPYELNQSVEAFLRLKNLGLDPSIEAMRSYGNTASAMGKDLMQMVEAVADASTGEFERLKEFGIKASKAGNDISFTFQGVTTVVKNNADAIQQYLLAIGNTQFAGGMEMQMQTLGGQFSNLKDNLDALYIALGQAGANNALTQLMTNLSAAIVWATENIDLLTQIIGTAVTAFITYHASAMAMTVAMGAYTSITAAATAGTAAFTAALLANPVGIVALAIAALAGGMFYLKNRTSELTDTTIIQSTEAKNLRAATQELQDVLADGSATQSAITNSRALVQQRLKEARAAYEAAKAEVARRNALANIPLIGGIMKLSADKVKKDMLDLQDAWVNGFLESVGLGKSSIDELVTHSQKATAKTYASNKKTRQKNNSETEREARELAKSLEDLNTSVINGLHTGMSETLKTINAISEGDFIQMMDEINNRSEKRVKLAKEEAEARAKNNEELLKTIDYLDRTFGLGGNLGAFFVSLKAGFGDAFDALSDVFVSLRDSLSDLLASFGSNFKKIAAGFSIGGIAAKATGGSALGGSIGGAAGSILGEKFLTGTLEKIGGKVFGKALGSFAGPLGAIAGGLLGGLIGGLFSKTKTGTATLTQIAGGAMQKTLGGNNAQLKGVADKMANGLLTALGNIAEQLGGTLGGAVNISVGMRKKDYVVDPTGKGRTKGAGVMNFGEDAAAAAAYATQLAIQQGIITGISAGAQTLIKAGGDLNTQVQKALKFDQVFKDLKKETDPLGASLDELAAEMTKLKAVFDEAGASAEDYAKLEELFAIKQAKAIFEANKPRRELEIQLMEAQGNAAGALAARRQLELESMDAGLRALQQQVWAAEDAAKAAQELADANAKAAEEAAAAAEAAKALAADRRSMEIDLMEALGNSAEALAARRQVELEAMDESLRALQQQIWAALDAKAAAEAAAEAAQVLAEEQAKAAEAVAKLATEKRELEIQLLEAQGFALEALTARRAMELEATDASLRSLKEAIWAAQAKAEADAAAAKAAEEAAAAEAKAAQDAADAMQKYMETLTDVSKTVQDEINRLRGINASSTSVLLKAQFATLTAQARTGNLDALGKLPELSKAIEEATIGSAGSALEVARIRAWLSSSLAETLGAQAASNAEINTAGAGLVFDGNQTTTATTAQTADAISNMRGDLYNALYQIAKNTGKSYELMDRWDGDGLPDIREDASDYY